MEETKPKMMDSKEEAEAEVEIWNFVFGFANVAVVKCAIELGIPEAVEKHQGVPITLSELSSTLQCAPSSLYRIMRFLAHHRIFKEITTNQGLTGYVQTPLSRRLLRQGEHSMADFVMLETSPVMLSPWHCLSGRVLINEKSAFEEAHGDDIWKYAAENPAHSKLIDDAMACDARLAVAAVVEGCPDVFDEIKTLVDIGGGNATALQMLVQAFPWIHGINFDLPHVVSVAPKCNDIEHVGGDMFTSIPNANAAFLMKVLHDWGDEDCIRILKNCKEAIPKRNGKVIIVHAVVGEETDKKLEFVRLALDMVMMAHTKSGRERTLKEWDYILRKAGFSSYNVRPIHAVQSVIEAFPDDA